MNHWPIFDEESVDVDYETEMVAEGWWRMAELGAVASVDLGVSSAVMNVRAARQRQNNVCDPS